MEICNSIFLKDVAWMLNQPFSSNEYYLMGQPLQNALINVNSLYEEWNPSCESK